MSRRLGVDHGGRRIGLAVSDSSGMLASPYRTVEGEEAFLAEVPGLVREYSLATIVVGLPLNMDGSAGPKAREVLAFCTRLRERLDSLGNGHDVAVVTWDERLSTVQAERLLKAGGLNPRQRRRRVDKVAAQIILQSYLDAR